MVIIAGDFNYLESFDQPLAAILKKLLPRSPGCESAMAQYPLLFPRYLSTHLPNLVLVSQNEQLV